MGLVYTPPSVAVAKDIGSLLVPGSRQLSKAAHQRFGFFEIEPGFYRTTSHACLTCIKAGIDCVVPSLTHYTQYRNMISRQKCRGCPKKCDLQSGGSDMCYAVTEDGSRLLQITKPVAMLPKGKAAASRVPRAGSVVAPMRPATPVSVLGSQRVRVPGTPEAPATQHASSSMAPPPLPNSRVSTPSSQVYTLFQPSKSTTAAPTGRSSTPSPAQVEHRRSERVRRGETLTPGDKERRTSKRTRPRHSAPSNLSATVPVSQPVAKRPKTVVATGSSEAGRTTEAQSPTAAGGSRFASFMQQAVSSARRSSQTPQPSSQPEGADAVSQSPRAVSVSNTSLSEANGSSNAATPSASRRKTALNLLDLLQSPTASKEQLVQDISAALNRHAERRTTNEDAERKTIQGDFAKEVSRLALESPQEGNVESLANSMRAETAKHDAAMAKLERSRQEWLTTHNILVYDIASALESFRE